MIALAEGNSREFEQALNKEMGETIKYFEHELATIRTGRASTSLVDKLKVDVYGQVMPLNQLATLSAPDPRLIVIQPWDKSTIMEIEKAIQTSDIGLTPINDGNVIRLQLPIMSSDRRDELTKQLGKKAEDSRVKIRNVRKEFQNLIRDAEKKKTLSEDFSKRLGDLLQKLTDQYISQINTLQSKKEAELKLV